MDAQLLIENFRSHLREQTELQNFGLVVFGSEEVGDILLYLYDINEMRELIDSEDQQGAREEWKSIPAFHDLGISVGMIGVQKPLSQANGECYGSWEVYRSAVNRKWRGKGIGKMMYEIAMVLSGGPIMSDRLSVSPSAEKVWNSLAITHDRTGNFDNVRQPATPPPEDDCIIGKPGTTDFGIEIDPSKEAAMIEKAERMHKAHKSFLEDELIPWVGYSETVIENKFRTLAISLFQNEYYEG